MTAKLPRRMQRQVARRYLSNVKVLVKPFVRRHKHAPFMPRSDELFLALFPQDRIALASRNHNDPPGPVPVRLLIGPMRENRHVARHLRIGKYNGDAHPSPAVGAESIPGRHVSKKIAEPIHALAAPGE